MGVGLAEKLHHHTRQAIAHGKDATHQPRLFQGTITADQDIEQNEEDRPLKHRLVELARMAGIGPAVGEDHGPRHVRNPAIELTIDEIGETAEEKTDRGGGADQVAEVEESDGVTAAEQGDCGDQAQKPTVERHAALPHQENLFRVGKIESGFVEQRIA